MKALLRGPDGDARVFIFRRTKLFWCELFHRTWRRRVALLQVEGSQRFYEVRCVKCGARETEIAQSPTTVLQ
jgi:hypothetical protein